TELGALVQLGDGVAGGPPIELVEERRRVLLPVRGAFPRRIVEPGTEAVGPHPFEQRRPVAERAVHHPAVLAAPDPEVARPVQRALTARDASAARGAILMEEAGNVLERRGDRRLQAHVDELAASGRLTREERRDDADRREDARLVVRLQAERAERR